MKLVNSQRHWLVPVCIIAILVIVVYLARKSGRTVLQPIPNPLPESKQDAGVGTQMKELLMSSSQEQGIRESHSESRKSHSGTATIHVPLEKKHDSGMSTQINEPALPSKQQVTSESQTVELPSSATKMYILAGLYSGGQQGAAIRSISSLQCFLSLLGGPYAMVEPQSSGIGWGYGGRLKFSTLFDLDHFNSESSKTSDVEMVTLEEFQQHGPNHVVAILAKEGKEVRSSVLWPLDPASTKMECLNNISVVGKFYGRLKMTRVKAEKCIIRVVVLPLKENPHIVAADPKEITRLFFGDHLSPQDVTLYVAMWKGHYYVPLDVARSGECKEQFSKTVDKPLFKPSRKLIHDAQEYERRFLGNRTELAVMIRTERVRQEYLKTEHLPPDLDTMDECFQGVIKLAQSRQGPNATTHPLVTLDVGHFGSKTIPGKKFRDVQILAEKTLATLYNYEWTMKDWERSFVEVAVAGGVTHPAYMAALQRTLASRADCMILMGGGNFQAQAVKDYYSYHEEEKDRCIDLVCAMTKPTLDLTELINELDKDY